MLFKRKGGGGILVKEIAFFLRYTSFPFFCFFFPLSVCVVVVPERCVFVAVALVSFSWKWRIWQSADFFLHVQVGERSVFEATQQNSVHCCHVVSSLWISFIWTLWPALEIRVSVLKSRLGRQALILLPHTLRRFSFSFPVDSTECGLGKCARGLAVQRDIVSSPLHIVPSKPGWRR